MRIQLPVVVLLAGLTAACPQPPLPSHPDPEPAPSPSPSPDPVLPVVRVELFPSAALLTQPGADVTFEVRAWDAEGHQVERPVIWSSSHPDTVAVVDGRATAQVALGSSLITAEVDGVRSAGALVLLAQPQPGVVLITDALVQTPPVAVSTSTEAPLAELQSEVVLRDVPTPTPGQLLLSVGGTPLLAKVVSSHPEGETVRVRYVLPALPEVFAQLRVDEALELEDVVVEASTSSDEDLPPPVPPEEKHNGFTPPGIPDIPWKMGPLKCKATPELVVLDSPIQIKFEQKLSFDFKADVSAGDIQHLRLVAHGKSVLQPTGGITLQLKGKVAIGCDFEAANIKIPISGPLAAVVVPAIPVGAGFSLEASYTAQTWQFLLEGKQTLETTSGIEFTPLTGLQPIGGATYSEKLQPRMVLDPESGAKNDDIELSAQLHAYTGLNLLFGVDLAKFGLMKLTSGPRMELKWEPEVNQAARPDFAAVHDLKWQTKWGLGSEAKDAMTLLRGVIAPVVTVEEKVDVIAARSPAGTLTLSRPRVQAGEPVRLTVAISPSTSHFLGLYNIEEVSLYRMVKEADGSTRLDAVPGLEPKAPQGEQREFTWEWRPQSAELGAHTFVAFTRTRLPWFTFEVADDSRAQLVVDLKCEASSPFPMCIESGSSVEGSGGVRVTEDGRIGGFVLEGEKMRAAHFNWKLEPELVGLLSSRPEAQSAAQGISPAGYLTGWADSVEPSNGGLLAEAFLWRDGNLQPLGTRALFGPTSQSYGKGVNDQGEVTGDVLRYQNGVWEAFAFVFSNGVLTDLGQIGASSQLGTGLVSGFDADGNVVGTRVVEIAPGMQIAEPTVWFRGGNGAWTRQALKHLGMGALLSGGNGRGGWVGSVSTSPTARVAARWTATGFKTLGSLGGSSHATASNAKGDVVGYSYASPGATERRAIRIDGATGKIEDLNSLIDPKLGWVLNNAVDINEEGVIVGQGLQHGQPRLFRLLPRAE